MKICKHSLIVAATSVFAAGLLCGCGGDDGRMSVSMATPVPMQTIPTEKTRLLGLSALETDGDGQSVVRAFVQPSGDGADAVYRFELYQYLPRAANPRGNRLRMWPEVAAGKAGADNPLWQPHLRAFEIVLPIENELSMKSTYLIELTVLKNNTMQHSDLLKITSKPAPKP